MKSHLAASAVLTAVLIATGCTGPAADPAADGHADHQHGATSSVTSSAAARPADVNDADIAFATMMIPHHQQAVELAALVPQRSSNPEVVTLAADISAAQAPEIQTMKSFLEQWTGGASTDHQGHDMSHMQGMVDKATLDQLTTLEGAPFDTLWLQSMIGHHEGAIGMANTELSDGANADAKKLAQQIVTAQQAEIVHMKQMLR